MKTIDLVSCMQFQWQCKALFSKNINHEKTDYSCVHVPRNIVHFGFLKLFNTLFLNCKTNGDVVMNISNVVIFMTGCLLTGCIAQDNDQAANGHAFMITDDSGINIQVVWKGVISTHK